MRARLFWYTHTQNGILISISFLSISHFHYIVPKYPWFKTASDDHRVIAFLGSFLNFRILSLNSYNPTINGLTTSTYAGPGPQHLVICGSWRNGMAQDSPPGLSPCAICTLVLLWLFLPYPLFAKLLGERHLVRVYVEANPPSCYFQTIHPLEGERVPETVPGSVQGWVRFLKEVITGFLLRTEPNWHYLGSPNYYPFSQSFPKLLQNNSTNSPTPASHLPLCT